MQPRLLTLFLFAVLVTLAGCAIPGQARTLDRVRITLSEPDCRTVRARVAAGSLVTLQVRNTGAQPVPVRWLIVPVSHAEQPYAPENIFWQVNLRPGFEVVEEIRAPEMPGDYDLVCGDQPAGKTGLSGLVTVIQPR
jgi:hypothetical protein